MKRGIFGAAVMAALLVLSGCAPSDDSGGGNGNGLADTHVEVYGEWKTLAIDTPMTTSNGNNRAYSRFRFTTTCGGRYWVQATTEDYSSVLISLYSGWDSTSGPNMIYTVIADDSGDDDGTYYGDYLSLEGGKEYYATISPVMDTRLSYEVLVTQVSCASPASPMAIKTATRTVTHVGQSEADLSSYYRFDTTLSGNYVVRSLAYSGEGGVIFSVYDDADYSNLICELTPDMAGFESSGSELACNLAGDRAYYLKATNALLTDENLFELVVETP